MAGILERYRDFYPFGADYPDGYPIVSLEEGNTPLIPARHLAAHAGADAVAADQNVGVLDLAVGEGDPDARMGCVQRGIGQ